MNPESDPHLDHVLNALRTAEPLSGFEARINARITARIAHTSPASVATPSFFAAILNAAKAARAFFRPIPLLAATATACIVILAIVSPRFYSPRHRNTSALANPLPIQSHTATRPPTTSSDSPTNAYLANDISSSQAFARHRHVINHPNKKGYSFSADHSQHPASPDTIALADTLAPSFPAPPEPPTAQEKLLVRVVHRGDPQVLTMLNPILRAQQQAKEKKDFEEFAGIPDAPHRL